MDVSLRVRRYVRTVGVEADNALTPYYAPDRCQWHGDSIRFLQDAFKSRRRHAQGQFIIVTTRRCILHGASTFDGSYKGRGEWKRLDLKFRATSAGRHDVSHIGEQSVGNIDGRMRVYPTDAAKLEAGLGPQKSSNQFTLVVASRKPIAAQQVEPRTRITQTS